MGTKQSAQSVCFIKPKQGRIQDFPDGRANPKVGGEPIILSEFSQKLIETVKKGLERANGKVKQCTLQKGWISRST